MNRSITYSKTEREIVHTGFAAVQAVLMGSDMVPKERLLFCLDYYMDPYYGTKLPYESELIGVLEHLVVCPNSLSVKEDALNLLTAYTWPPYPILQSEFDKIETELQADVRYAIYRQENRGN